jgi:hypothetical protein
MMPCFPSREAAPEVTQDLNDDLAQLHGDVSPASGAPDDHSWDLVFAACFLGLFLGLAVMTFALVPGFRFVAMQFLRLLIGCVAPECV